MEIQVEQSCRVCMAHEGHCRYANLSPADIWNLVATSLEHISKSFDPVVRANIRRIILNLMWHYRLAGRVCERYDGCGGSFHDGRCAMSYQSRV